MAELKLWLKINEQKYNLVFYLFAQKRLQKKF